MLYKEQSNVSLSIHHDDVLRERAILNIQPHDVVMNLKALAKSDILNVVHYLWCSKKVFEFRQYLTLKSVIRFIYPDRLVIHYKYYPLRDKYLYNDWLNDLKDEFPFVELNQLKNTSSACQSKEKRSVFKENILNKDGGIFIYGSIIITNFPSVLYNIDLVNMLVDDEEAVVIAKPKVFTSYTRNILRIKCISSATFTGDLRNQVCISHRTTLYPRDAWHRNDSFSLLVNSLMYGQNIVPQPLPSSTNLIPNIAHMMWIGGGKMNYLFYLSCLSLINIVKVDTVYIHGDKPPSGKYWEMISNRSQIKFIRRLRPNFIYNQTISVRNHMSDVFRAEVLVKYGGIYCDTDVLWLNPIPEKLREYGAVAAYDWPIMRPTYPDYINFGVTMGKRNDPFWHMMLASMKTFKDDSYGYNGLLKPYKVYERHPDLVYIYDYLQIMCWKLKCHPTWVKDFRNPKKSHLNLTNFDWQRAISVHWTSPTPVELQDEETLLASNSLWAEIGLYAYSKIFNA